MSVIAQSNVAGMVLLFLLSVNNVVYTFAPGLDGWMRLAVMSVAAAIAAISPVTYHFELPRFEHPKFKLNRNDIFIGVASRSVVVGMLFAAVAAFGGPVGALVALAAQLLLAGYSVALIANS